MQKEKKLRKNEAITLITLIVTIVVMLILAGVAMYFTIGEQGILDKVAKSSKEYENAYEKEKTDLDNLYSEMLIATNDDSKVTISVADLNKLIEEKVDKKVTEKMTNFILTPDYEKVEEIVFTDKSYTAPKDGYIQVNFCYTEPLTNGVVWDGIYINEKLVFCSQNSGTWQNLNIPPILIKKGDVITYENKAQIVTGYYYPIQY